MRTVLAVAGLLAVLVLSAAERAGAEAPFCRFEVIEDGVFEKAVKVEGGYEVTIDREIETRSAVIKAETEFFPVLENILAAIEKGRERPTVAFLYQGRELCGFLPVKDGRLYFQKYNLRNDKYIIGVCREDTDDCFHLKISPGNDLFAQAEKILPPMKSRVVYLIFAEDGEILTADIIE